MQSTVSQGANKDTREKYATNNKRLKTANICSLNRNFIFMVFYDIYFYEF